jgi:phosphoserine phosphatase RsbU/P
LGECAIRTIRGVVIGLVVGLLMGGLLSLLPYSALPLGIGLLGGLLGGMLGWAWMRRPLQRADSEVDPGERLRCEERFRLKEEFFSSMTHELRTPLTSIRSFAEILHTAPPDEEEVRQEFLEIIHEEAERMSRLVNELLDISKIEAECMVFDLEPVDLAEQGRLVTRLFRPVLQEKRISIELDLPEGLAPVLADRDRVHQVLTNLLGNAARFSPDGGRIRLSARSHGEVMEFQVEDQGRGVPEPDRERIFDAYKQVAVEGGAKEGTGLGLPISRLLVENMGGSIRCEASRDLGGACLAFRLPRVQVPVDESPATSAI